MSQAITTKSLKPTDRRGARIKATSASGVSVSLSFDYAANEFERHSAACRALAEKLQWHGEWFGGSTKDGHVFVQRDAQCPPVVVARAEGC